MFRGLLVLLTITSAFRSAEIAARTSKPFWLKRLECIEQPYKYTTIFRCHVDSQRNSPQMVQIAMNITQLATKVFIDCNLYAKHRQSQTLLYGTTFEYCEFMGKEDSRRNPVAVIIYNYAKHNFPQVIRPCPIGGLFEVNNLPMDENMIPPFVTPGTYLSTQRFYNKRNETLLYYVAEFYVGAPSIFNKSMSVFTFK